MPDEKDELEEQDINAAPVLENRVHPTSKAVVALDVQDNDAEGNPDEADAAELLSKSAPMSPLQLETNVITPRIKAWQDLASENQDVKCDEKKNQLKYKNQVFCSLKQIP